MVTGGARGKRGKAKPQRPPVRPRRTPQPRPAAPVEEEPDGPFRLGFFPGATPGTWVDRWQDRRPRHPLELVPLAVADQRAALADGLVDAALVRLPLDRDGLSVIPLYDEVPVVVASVDSHLTAADELDAADLVGEVRLVPLDDVLALTLDGTVAPRFAPLATTEEAIATVASGVGFVVVPMSLARLHHRKDVASRPLRDAPVSSVALAWVADRTTPAVDAFIGIVRGRTANSSRG